jgi:hypothetical protein
VSVEGPAGTPTEQRTGATGADTTDSPRSEPSDDRRQIEQAIARYVEAAERGEVDVSGLPTSDELTIRRVELAGARAQAALAGGARLSLRKAGGRWRVVSASVPRIKPSPPSNG